jgi:hypothetical protein
MSIEKQPVPAELAEWLADELEKITKSLRSGRSVARQHDDDAERWTLGVLSAATDMWTTAERIVHVVTKYGLDSEVTKATPIARACGVTISTVTSRAGSRLATKTSNEIWPQSR